MARLVLGIANSDEGAEMCNVKRLCGVLFMLFTLSATATAAANAEELGVLPAPTTEKPLALTLHNDTGNAAKLVGRKGGESNIFECEAVEGTAKLTSSTLGTGDILFLKCATKSKTVSCKGSTDTVTGHITVPVDVHIVDLEINAKLLLGLLIILLSEVNIKCSVATMLVKGALIGDALDNEKGEEIAMPAAGTVALLLAKGILFRFAQALGVQAIKTCHAPAALCTGKTYSLLTNFSTGFEEAAEEALVTLEEEAKGTIHIDY
jgi:hypothetical protein